MSASTRDILGMIRGARRRDRRIERDLRRLPQGSDEHNALFWDHWPKVRLRVHKLLRLLELRGFWGEGVTMQDALYDAHLHEFAAYRPRLLARRRR